jgi:circadian clock protein KaiC
MSLNPIEKVPTGVPGLDVITYGGVPEGRSTLVAGRSGVGKTILALKMASHFAQHGVKTLMVAVEERPRDLIRTGDNLGLRLTELIAEGSLRLSDATRPMDGPMVVSGEYDITALIHRIRAHVESMGAKAVIIDSATALFSPRPPQELMRNLFFQLVYSLGSLEVTSVILAESSEDYGQLTTLGVEDYVCDAVFIMRNVIDGERRRRTIEVAKYRGSPHYKGEYPCAITGRGVAIFPLDARERPESDSMERYSSGFPGLDALIGGGLIRDSIVIVRGPTGSGKTMLAGLYARAGAARGERVVYFGFEEPRPILLRNFSAIGMPLKEYEKAGNLKLNCRYPEALSLEDMLVTLRHEMEDFQPSLVVLDSISSIEHSSSEKGFRQFMIGLASLLREHGRSALLTQTVLGGHAAEHTAPYLSTIADGILVLDYSAQEYELKRTLRVLKMRGSAHVTHPYRLSIEQGGLRVEPLSLRHGEDRAPAAPQPRQSLKGVRILWVEDFGDSRETVEFALTAEGAEVMSVGTAEEALTALGSFVPHAILCDIGLPDEDGYSLLRRIRHHYPALDHVPALALTAWAGPEDRRRAEDAGFVAHLKKPVEPRDLLDTLLSFVRAPLVPPARSGR